MLVCDESNRNNDDDEYNNKDRGGNTACNNGNNIESKNFVKLGDAAVSACVIDIRVIFVKPSNHF